MASNTPYNVFRTSVAGRQPNTINSSNNQYISAGGLALNMTDQILYTSDGTNLIYIGANQMNMNITGNTNIANGANINIIANGTITSRNLSSRFSDVLNLKDFGAIGDGITDDSQAIANWLSNAVNIKISSNTSVLLYAPGSNYMVNGAVNIPTINNAPVSIKGDGCFHTVFILGTGFTGTFLQFSNTGHAGITPSNAYGTHLQSFTISGNINNLNTIQNGIQFCDKNDGIFIEDVWCTNLTGYGMNLGANSLNTNNASVEESFFSRIKLWNCAANNNSTSFIISSNNIGIGQTSSTNNLRFIGLDIYGSNGLGLSITSPSSNTAGISHLEFFGLRVESSTGNNIVIGSANDGSSINIIKVKGLSCPSILTGTYGITINANTSQLPYGFNLDDIYLNGTGQGIYIGAWGASSLRMSLLNVAASLGNTITIANSTYVSSLASILLTDTKTKNLSYNIDATVPNVLQIPVFVAAGPGGNSTISGTANQVFISNGVSGGYWSNSISLSDSNGLLSLNSTSISIGNTTSPTSTVATFISNSASPNPTVLIQNGKATAPPLKLVSGGFSTLLTGLSSNLSATTYIALGNSTANNIFLYTNGQIAAGVNAYMNTSAFFIGNTTTFVTINSSAINVGNSLSNVTINSSTTFNGGPIGSNTQIAFNNSGTESGDANLTWNTATTTLSLGNSTSNAMINPTSLSIGSNLNLSTSNLMIGNSSTNGVFQYNNLIIDNGTLQVQVNPTAGFRANNSTSNSIGQLSGTQLYIGNSSINSAMNSTSLQIGSNFSVNATILGFTTNTFNLGTANAVGPNGYCYLPMGMKMNWGWVSATGTTGAVTFESAFTTNAFIVVSCGSANVSTKDSAVTAWTKTGCTILTSNATASNCYYIAIGL